ncbi:MAG TPA: hypothetical protein EYQ73_00965 [Candidatus Poseidoniales archaeon]|nr:MAG: hypothetical protein CXT71_05710 [Euryarchaeota archaeon]HIF45356.1 hypothetical protein [Candidatus Poseidoniales archaeon]HIL64995.1 hypothetical protein [Candidatus Poseidoniales archaeon]
MRLMVLAMLLSASLAPMAMAEVKWVEDGWLKTIGPEHLVDGDEFGCYGMPNLEWQIDPGAVALECREYIEARTDASKWDAKPISTYTPNGLTAAQHTVIGDQGFLIHGDQTGQSASAWHDSENEPERGWDWYDLGRRGGSLEQGIADIDQIESELDQGGLVNFHWVGKLYDATVRHDRDVVAMLEQRDDIWFTTWGEAYSYWQVEKCHQFNHSKSDLTIKFEHQRTDACDALEPNAWKVPVTWIFELKDSSVISVNLPEMSIEDSNLKQGWRQEGDLLYISILEGNEVNINLSDDSDYDIVGRTQFFNNKSTAVTIAGHSTTDLFTWSKRFDESPELKFTWLISPRSLDQANDWLPYLGAIVLAGSVSAIFLILKKESKAQSRAEALMRESSGGEDDE